jgi:hypothetical protein
MAKPFCVSEFAPAKWLFHARYARSGSRSGSMCSTICNAEIVTCR